VTIDHSGSRQQSRLARLYLNDTEVGLVSVRGRSGSWTFGEFTPSPPFSDFAPVFAHWSMLMHAENAGRAVDAELSEKLRAEEYRMDAIRASLLIDSPEERHQIRQLNIDGCLIEWKE
jgi:hypothetical protein